MRGKDSWMIQSSDESKMLLFGFFLAVKKNLICQPLCALHNKHLYLDIFIGSPDLTLIGLASRHRRPTLFAGPWLCHATDPGTANAGNFGSHASSCHTEFCHFVGNQCGLTDNEPEYLIMTFIS